MRSIEPPHPDALPSLTPELVSLDPPATDRSRAVHELAATALAPGREAYWIDARNTVSVATLTTLAPSERTLAGLRVARAFTAHQHHTLVRRVVREASPETAVVVVPRIASLYADDDCPSPNDRTYLRASLSLLCDLARAAEFPVLVTPGIGDDTGLATLVEDYAERTIDCTRVGPGYRYDAPDVESQWYRVDGGWQTTIPYWIDRLGVAGRSGLWPTTPEPFEGAMSPTVEG